MTGGKSLINPNIKELKKRMNQDNDISKACQGGDHEECYICNCGCHDEPEKIADSSLRTENDSLSVPDGRD